MNLLIILLILRYAIAVSRDGLFLHNNVPLGRRKLCLINYKLVDCYPIQDRIYSMNGATKIHNDDRTGIPIDNREKDRRRYAVSSNKNSFIPGEPSLPSMHQVEHSPMPKVCTIPEDEYTMQRRFFFPNNFASNIIGKIMNYIPLPLWHSGTKDSSASYYKPSVITSFPVSTPHTTASYSGKTQSPIQMFMDRLDEFERKFYTATFSKLLGIAPAERQENGISFVQSGFYLFLTLMALTAEVDPLTRNEITRCTGLVLSNKDITRLIRYFISHLPESSENLKFEHSSRLSLWPGRDVSQAFRGPAAALQLMIDKFNGTETTEDIIFLLNSKMEIDSGGAFRDTFDEEDITDGVQAVLVTMLYMRGRWRTAPVVLNGTHVFRDSEETPHRTVRMIRINDHIQYAKLPEWNAEALEIPYARPGLSLLMLVPRTPSLRHLVPLVGNTSVHDITRRMRTMRVAVTMPLFTLRMTLLLANKLEEMGISRLVNTSDRNEKSLRLSHMVQRLMFWPEVGRNAFKDDGIEWDEAPQLQVFVDRPYIFFVRWRNITIMNGNFVL